MEDAWRCYMCRLSRLFHPLPQCFYRRSVLLWYRHARLNWVKLISPALWASLNRYYTHPPFILNTPVQRNHGFWSGISTFHWDHWDRASGVFSLVWTGDGITIPMTQEKRGPKKKKKKNQRRGTIKWETCLKFTAAILGRRFPRFSVGYSRRMNKSWDIPWRSRMLMILEYLPT